MFRSHQLNQACLEAQPLVLTSLQRSVVPSPSPASGFGSLSAVRVLVSTPAIPSVTVAVVAG
ncbi:hypothetical protein V8C44DRAFT_342171 [Trichoderma aethiopicum]